MPLKVWQPLSLTSMLTVAPLGTAMYLFSKGRLGKPSAKEPKLPFMMISCPLTSPLLMSAMPISGTE